MLAGQLDRALVRLCPGVGEEDAAADARLAEPLRQSHHRLGVEEVRRMHQAAGLLANGLDHLRMAVPDRADRDPGDEVEVLLVVGVPKPGPLAAHELDGRPPVGLHHVAMLERLQLFEAHRTSKRVCRTRHQGVTIVPMPASVNSSSSKECGLRPSMMWAYWVPTPIASMQACSFGRIPPATA